MAGALHGGGQAVLLQPCQRHHAMGAACWDVMLLRQHASMYNRYPQLRLSFSPHSALQCCIAPSPLPGVCGSGEVLYHQAVLQADCRRVCCGRASSARLLAHDSLPQPGAHTTVPTQHIHAGSWFDVVFPSCSIQASLPVRRVLAALPHGACRAMLLWLHGTLAQSASQESRNSLSTEALERAQRPNGGGGHGSKQHGRA